MLSAAGVQTYAGSPDGEPRILRALAHELRQPLSAIESTAYYLDLALPHEEERARGHAHRLHELVQQAGWILACAVELADPRPAAVMPLQVEELITQAAVVLRASPGIRAAAAAMQSEGVLLLDLAGDLPLVLLEPNRGYRLIENLLALFLQKSNDEHPTRVRTALREEGVVIEVTNARQGIVSEAALGPGCKIAIESFHRLAELHGGSFTFSAEPVGGLRARILFPLDQQGAASVPQRR